MPVAFVVAIPAQAGAHANLVGVAPADEVTVDATPKEVSVRFDAVVSIDFGGGLKVFGPDGKRTDKSVASLRDEGRTVVVGMKDEQRGTYTVTWRVVSEDAHIIIGSSVFHVAEVTGAVAPTESQLSPFASWFGRWIVLSSATALGGALVLRKRRKSIPTRRIAALATAALVTGSLIRFGVQVSAASGRSLFGGVELWPKAVSSTRSGRLDLVRIIGATLAAVAVWQWRRTMSKVLGALALLVVFASNALNGHAWTAQDNWPTVGADILHQGSAAIWAGALVTMLLASRQASFDPNLLRWFSALSMRTVGVLLVTGGWATFAQMGFSRDALATRYGQLLLAKVSLFAGMLVLGFAHRQRIRRTIVNALTSRGLAMEVALAAIILGITASLTGSVPPNPASLSQPYYARIASNGLAADVTVFPAKRGTNTFHLYFFDASGNPTDTVDAAELTLEAKGVPARKINLARITNDHYSALGFTVPRPGRWTFTLSTVRRGVADEFRIDVPIK